MAGPASARSRAHRISSAWISFTIPLATLLLSPRVSNAQVSQDAAVQVSATVQSVSPPQILLSWPLYTATGYTVYRKKYSDSSWGSPIATPPGSAIGYVDAAISAGVPYEYQVARSASVFA